MIEESNGPFGAGPTTIWDLPRVVTEAVPAGQAIAADWRNARLWNAITGEPLTLGALMEDNQ